MQVGLLWFDSDPGRDVASKAKDAARRYRAKFGVSPDTCYVNCKILDAETIVRFEDGGEATLRLSPARNVLAHHFWVGVEERTERQVGVADQVIAN